MKGMFELEIENIINDINSELKANKHSIEIVSKKIYNSILDNLKSYNLISFQRRNSTEKLSKMINAFSILLAKKLHYNSKNKRFNTQNLIKSKASKQNENKIYDHIKNEINYWKNEK
jgi:hypothetical protein